MINNKVITLFYMVMVCLSFGSMNADWRKYFDLKTYENWQDYVGQKYNFDLFKYFKFQEECQDYSSYPYKFDKKKWQDEWKQECFHEKTNEVYKSENDTSINLYKFDMLFFSLVEFLQIRSLGHTKGNEIEGRVEERNYFHAIQSVYKLPYTFIKNYFSWQKEPKGSTVYGLDVANQFYSTKFLALDARRINESFKLAYFHEKNLDKMSKAQIYQYIHLAVNKLGLAAAIQAIQSYCSDERTKNSLFSLVKLIQDISETKRKKNFYAAEFSEEYEEYCKKSIKEESFDPLEEPRAVPVDTVSVDAVVE